MQRLIFVGIVSLMALAGSVKAEMWCGYGSGTALDHPCQDDNSSIDAVLDEYKGEWAAISGGHIGSLDDDLHGADLA